MSAILELWPIILGGLGVIYGFWQKMGKKDAVAEAQHQKRRASSQEARAKHSEGQLDAINEGETTAKEIIEKAHDKGSVSDLRESGY